MPFHGGVEHHASHSLVEIRCPATGRYGIDELLLSEVSDGARGAQNREFLFGEHQPGLVEKIGGGHECRRRECFAKRRAGPDRQRGIFVADIRL